MSQPPHRLFSRAEAEAMLPEIGLLLAQAQAVLEKIEAYQPPSAGSEAREQRNGHIEVGRATGGSSRVQLEELIARIEALGVLVKDVASGLIDFPAVRNGQEVYLCWRRGEPLHIGWWHEIRAGFAGRMQIADDDQAWGR